MKDKIITRRDFLRITTGAAVAASLEPGILGDVQAEQRRKLSSSEMLKY